MSQIPTEDQNPHGLHKRYNITKANGEDVDHLATYFVLRIDEHGRDEHHIEACQQAAIKYAETILDNPDAQHLHLMAQQLLAMVENQRASGL